jgi:hypothetical protein
MDIQKSERLLHYALNKWAFRTYECSQMTTDMFHMS